jgi:hypothetical protein
VPDVIARIDRGRCCLCEGGRYISSDTFAALGAAATYNLFLVRPGTQLGEEIVPCPLCGMFSPLRPSSFAECADTTTCLLVDLTSSRRIAHLGRLLWPTEDQREELAQLRERIDQELM